METLSSTSERFKYIMRLNIAEWIILRSFRYKYIVYVLLSEP